MTETIDMTPTWAQICGMLIAALQDGTPEGKRLATLELQRMAGIADLHVAASKQGPAQPVSGPGRGVTQAAADSMARDLDRHAQIVQGWIDKMNAKAKRNKTWRPSELAMAMASWKTEIASMQFAADLLRGRAHIVKQDAEPKGGAE
jgi:hypothetical protein